MSKDSGLVLSDSEEEVNDQDIDYSISSES